ncbi:hypothetical protein MRX96_010025 [Rhipicephalus microplus]
MGFSNGPAAVVLSLAFFIGWEGLCDVSQEVGVFARPPSLYDLELIRLVVRDHKRDDKAGSLLSTTTVFDRLPVLLKASFAVKNVHGRTQCVQVP